MARTLESHAGNPPPSFSFPTPNTSQPQYGYSSPPPLDPHRRGASPAPPIGGGFYAPPPPPQGPFNGQPLNVSGGGYHRTTSPRPLPQPGRPQSPQWQGSAPSPYLGSARPHSTASYRQSTYSDLGQSFADLTFSSPSHSTVPLDPPKPPTPPSDPSKPPELTIKFPTVASLFAASQSISSADPTRKLAWAKDVLNLVDRTQQASGDTTRIADAELARLADTAVSYVVAICSSWTQGSQPPPYIPEAMYLRGTLSSSGAYPNQLARDPRAAFKDFEASARMGFHASWFRLGRDYEAVGDLGRAKDCFERGVRLRDKSCLYVSHFGCSLRDGLLILTEPDE